MPDFQGNEDSIRAVLEARPDIYNHDTETVPRLYKKARPGGRYERLLEILRTAKRIEPPPAPPRRRVEKRPLPERRVVDLPAFWWLRKE